MSTSPTGISGPPELEPDVIEKSVQVHGVGELDMSGWELRKTLKIFRSDTPQIAEWLRSPVIYVESGPLAPFCGTAWMLTLPRAACAPLPAPPEFGAQKDGFREPFRQDLAPCRASFPHHAVAGARLGSPPGASGGARGVLGGY